MEIEFDPDKEATNLTKHKISLKRAAEMETLSLKRDLRFDYGEERFRAWGLIDGETYCFAFTTRGERVRAISLRRAHDKEMDRNVP
ncbi:MAG: BrnT family toxin [Devosia sp.]